MLVYGGIHFAQLKHDLGLNASALLHAFLEDYTSKLADGMVSRVNITLSVYVRLPYG